MQTLNVDPVEPEKKGCHLFNKYNVSIRYCRWNHSINVLIKCGFLITLGIYETVRSDSDLLDILAL